MQNLRWANDQHIGVCYDTPEASVYLDGGTLYQAILAGEYGPIANPGPSHAQPVKPTNAEQSEKRKLAYEQESDPIFFLVQRGEATTEQWDAKIAKIKTRYPYYYDEQGNLLEGQA